MSNPIPESDEVLHHFQIALTQHADFAKVIDHSPDRDACARFSELITVSSSNSRLEPGPLVEHIIFNSA
ncbi:hypothetical protein [Streptomyces levis]|uniref:hypothetical protein n=1 Tax=Streptomyces levis TaxID=285566 RepID=UPI0031E12114